MGKLIARAVLGFITLTMVVRLLEEEKFLRAHLSDYEEYRQKVRYRLIPFIW